MSVAVAVVGLQPAGAVTPVASVASVVPGEVLTRPDRVSAMVTAGLVGRRVEDLSQRTETVQVFANPDGSWTSEGFAEPVRVVDEQGTWREVDTTLGAGEDGLVPAVTVGEVVFSDGGDRVFAALIDERGERVEFGWPTMLPVPVVEGDTATYRDALPGVGDLVVTATSTGFTHNIVIPQQPAEPVQVTIPVAVEGAALVEKPGGELAVQTTGTPDETAEGEADDRGVTVVAAALPVMWDSSQDRGGEPQAAAVDATVTDAAGGTSRLTLSPAEEFLSDPETVYPVTVDPSFTINPSGDTWLQYPNYSSSQSASGELKVGTYDGGDHVARSFLRFDNGTAGWAGVNVTKAELRLSNYYSGSCSSSAIRAARLTKDWTVSGLTWANQPTGDAVDYVDYAPAKGYSSSCPGGDAVFAVTPIVQAWSVGHPNYGIRLRAVDESSIHTWRRYRSANYATSSARPRLTVTYNSYPNTAGAVSVAPGNPGYATSLTPTLSSKVSDPDGAKVRAVFEVHRGSTLVWTGSSSGVASGSVAALRVPEGKLAAGVTYTVRARGEDGMNTSKAASAATTFTTDTSKPVVRVSATGFTADQWVTDPPGSNTFTFDGPGDTKSFAYTVDGVAGPVKAADSSGDATHVWAPKSGAHQLRVTAIDKAGNTGPATTFAFGVGAASLAAPAADAASVGTFPIEASGPPGATGAELWWRYPDSIADPGAGVGPGEGWAALSGVVTAEGTSWAATQVATTSGQARTPRLVWNATAQKDPAAGPTATIVAPALIELRACFTYPTAPTRSCSAPRQVQLLTAFESNFPTTQLGPVTLGLLTGQVALTEADAVDTAAGLGRTLTTPATPLTTPPATTGTTGGATGGPGPFGPGWETTVLSAGDSAAELVDHRAKDRTFVVVTTGGSSQMFTPRDPAVDPVTATGPVQFLPAGVDDGSRLLLKGSTVTLTRPQGTVTTWTRDAEGDWAFQDAQSAETAKDRATAAAMGTGGTGGTGPAPEASVEYQDGYPSWIAQSAPGEATTCTEEVQEAGCRGLRITYTGADEDRRVASVDRVTAGTAPARLATYTYADGLLTTVCGPDRDADLGVEGPLSALCLRYGYGTVAGRLMLTRYIPPGEQVWRLGYDSARRLTTVSRTLDEHTAGGQDGEVATWTISYDLDPATTGLPDLTADTAAQWGQSTVPVRAFAVFAPTRVPASAAPTAEDLEHAQLWYVDTEGKTTNIAVHGNTDANTDSDGSGAGQWLVETTWYDEHGNTTRTLDAAGRTRALAAAPADRAAVAQEGSAITVYNPAGSRVEEEYGPVHTATLTDGTTGPFRAYTAYTYDEEAPGLGGGSKPAYTEDQPSFDLIVETRHGATTPDMESDYDITVVGNDYAPLVAGDGNGWELGTPTRTKVLLEDGSWSSTVTRYDAEGRQVETRQPGGAAAADGAGADAHATVLSYYTPGAVDPDCRTTDTAHPKRQRWVGLSCKSGPAAQPTGPPMPITYYAAYNDDLQPTRVVESSGSTTRTTTTSYDDLGRATTTTVTDGEDTRTATTGYHPTTGLPATVTSPEGTITTGYDSWGRVHSYTDATGMVSTTTYTPDGQVATFHDGEGIYTYTYDQPTGEHRGLPTSVDVGLPDGAPDTFTLTYNARGAHSTLTYPNGMVARYGYDEIGAPTSLEYTNPDGEVLLPFTATIDVDGRTIANTSAASAQNYTYDELGRLTRVQDTRDGGCTTRTYGFSPASERTRFNTFAPTDDGTCQTSTPAVTNPSTYDTANRIRNTGYTYDDLGRTLTVPAGDTTPGAAGPLTVGYHANDMVKTLTQDVQDANGETTTDTMVYGLDPTGRINTITTMRDRTVSNRVRYRFSEASDSPTSILASEAADWVSTRFITIPGLGMAGSQARDTFSHYLTNLHGDIVATQAAHSETLSIDSYGETDEYGNPIDNSIARYGWLGKYQRSTETIGGGTLMGARLYNPATGVFASVDPVRGGSATAYEYCFGDPVNCTDLAGTYSYSRSYSLGRYFRTSPSSLMQWIRSNFWTFPLPGCGGRLTFETCSLLGGNPVRVVAMSSTSWTFRSLPGHAEGANKYITFLIVKGFTWGPGHELKLNVRANGPDNTWCNRSKPCSWLNKNLFATLSWAAFAHIVQIYSRVHGRV